MVRGKVFKGTMILLLTFFIGNESIARNLNSSTVRSTVSHRNPHHEKINKFKQPERIKNASSGWSSWSAWTNCSQPCDGGVMHQIRQCRKPNGCKGDAIRYKICNLQQCTSARDFRLEQCGQFNNKTYDGVFYRWTPYFDYAEPCSLTCRGSPVHLNRETPRPAWGPNDDEESEYMNEQDVIVQLATKVEDGTRCRPGSLDMCIEGICREIGCDLKIGSTKKVDECGECGGDGTSCSPPAFQLEATPNPTCETCGGGYRVTRRACRDRTTGAEVEHSLCETPDGDDPTEPPCLDRTCPPRWIIEEWSPCSHLCGTGHRERMVVCAKEDDGLKIRVADSMCQSPKPLTQKLCMLEKCPIWEVEEWSPCSVTCGYGIQTRGVECKSLDGYLSAKCDPHTRPEGYRSCLIDIPCYFNEEEDESNSTEYDYMEDSDEWSRKLKEDAYNNPVEHNYQSPDESHQHKQKHRKPSVGEADA